MEHNELINKLYLELEKNAGLLDFAPKLLKYFSKIKTLGQTRGSKSVVNYLKSHGSDYFVKDPKNVKKIKQLRSYAPKGETGALQKAIGNSVRSLHELGKGVVTDSKIDFKRLGKNFYNINKKELASSLYRSVPMDKTKVIDRKRVFGILKRPVVGKTQKGEAIIKKTPVGQLLGVSTTPVGFGAGTALLGEGSASKKIEEGVKEYGVWQFARPYAGAKIIKNFIFSN